ncbi:hypothetical protein D3C71_1498880 [compost metagenome]
MPGTWQACGVRIAKRAIHPFDGLVTYADTVVQAMKTRAHPQALAPAAKPQSHIRVLKALAQLRDRHNSYELARRHTNELGHHHQNGVAQQVIQQVVAVVAPHRHLLLGMVQGVQAPPPLKMVLSPVDPIVHKIEHDQIHQQADPRDIGDTRPNAIELEGANTGDPQRTKKIVGQRINGQEQTQAEKAQSVDQGVENVGADGGTVGHGFYRPETLQRANHHQNHR